MDRIRRFAFQRSFSRRECGHLEQVTVTTPVEPVCPSCADIGADWVHVRMCLICGVPGCCDSSNLKHARQHYAETGHPLIRSIEPGESWAWCYVEKAYLEEIRYRDVHS